jgi:hypothetical protein
MEQALFLYELQTASYFSLQLSHFLPHKVGEGT